MLGLGSREKWTTAKIGLAALAGILSFVVSLAGKQPPPRQPKVRFVQAVRNIPAGTPFTPEMFQQVDLPADLRGSLKEAAVSWRDRVVLYQRPAARDLLRGDLLLHRDVVDPRRRIDIREDEVALHVRMAGATLEPSLLNVGDQVGFVAVDRRAGMQPFDLADAMADAAGDGSENDPDDDAPELRPGEVLGPFRLVTVGNQSMPGQQVETGGAAVVTVAGRLGPDNRLNREARSLLALTSSNKQLSVVLYSRRDREPMADGVPPAYSTSATAGAPSP